MPMLKFKGIPKEEILKKSTALTNELMEAIKCPRETLTIELLDTVFIADGKEVLSPTIVEVFWFSRSQEVQDEVAKIITKYFRDDRVFLDVIFFELERNSYYENGTHF